MVKCPCAPNSAEQLSNCFFSALFSEALALCNAKENSVSWKELPGVWCFSPPWLDTLESSLEMDTCCAVSSWKHHRQHLGRHTVQTGGFTESSNSKGCWSQLLARWDKADNSLYMGGFHTPCPVTIFAYLPLSLYLHFSVIQCAIFSTVWLFDVVDHSNEFGVKSMFFK